VERPKRIKRLERKLDVPEELKRKLLKRQLTRHVESRMRSGENDVGSKRQKPKPNFETKKRQDALLDVNRSRGKKLIVSLPRLKKLDVQSVAELGERSGMLRRMLNPSPKTLCAFQSRTVESHIWMHH
jgi:short subunit dehydrogenase-like uncharacterized protein